MLSIIIHVFYSSQNDYRMFLFVLRVYVSICYYWFWLGGRFGTNLPIRSLIVVFIGIASSLIISTTSFSILGFIAICTVDVLVCKDGVLLAVR